MKYLIGQLRSKGQLSVVDTAALLCMQIGEFIEMYSQKYFGWNESEGYICTPKNNGSIAQLVQSICLTSRGSAVRTRVLPQNEKVLAKAKAFFHFNIV